jgi:hypothetical protein
MKLIRTLLANDSVGAALRALIRALCALFTAFGLKLSGEQVAGVQLLLEALLQFAKAVATAIPTKKED